MNVILPEHLEEITIKDMIIGESGYAVAWAMYAERDSTLWLNGDYTFDKEPGGTADMKIERVNGGFKVDISKVDLDSRKWSSSGPGFSDSFTPVPVVELIGA